MPEKWAEISDKREVVNDKSRSSIIIMANINTHVSDHYMNVKGGNSRENGRMGKR